MKIDCSKLSNKDDLVVLISMLLLLFCFCLVVYLASYNHFVAGFVSATFIWNWKNWLYQPVDHFFEQHWPAK